MTGRADSRTTEQVWFVEDQIQARMACASFSSESEY